MTRKILITGAGGFIGSHLTETLLENGYTVRAFVHYNSRNDWGALEYLSNDKKNNIELLTGDIIDPDRVNQIVKGMDAVLHLAALPGVPFSYISPNAYFQINTMGTLNLLQACLKHNVSKVINTSSSEVYGSAKYIPMDEKHPLNPQSPYAASKTSADHIAESFFFSYDLPVITLRLFNVYGPRQSARAIIPSIITQSLARGEVRLGSLSPARDFTFVSDSVTAFLLALQTDNVIGKTFNIGSGKSISVAELAHILGNIMEKKLTVITDEIRIRKSSSEVDNLVCNNLRAFNTLDWSPKISLDKGIESTLVWYKNNIDKFKSDLYNI